MEEIAFFLIVLQHDFSEVKEYNPFEHRKIEKPNSLVVIVLIFSVKNSKR